MSTTGKRLRFFELQTRDHGMQRLPIPMEPDTTLEQSVKVMLPMLRQFLGSVKLRTISASAVEYILNEQTEDGMLVTEVSRVPVPLRRFDMSWVYAGASVAMVFWMVVIR